MSIREAALTDADALKDVTERSMQASYAVGPGTIEVAVEEWFGKEPLAEKIGRESRAVFVRERDDELLGVVDAAVPEPPTGEILWLHVDPAVRGEGVGRELFEHARSWLEAAGAEHVRGLVLAENADGTAFYGELGFERAGEREVEIDGTTYTEYVFRDEDRDAVDVLRVDGRELYVDREDPRHGSLDPFYVVYADLGCSDRYGYRCGHCDALATAMDSMGRIECEDCGNSRKPTRWDAAYM